ncbi:hypothetical protein Val02_67840 [Virgisporangium aliadipatigenens]|uniref:Uncharacterized protein n=1 Tax=Virgisporangium aliadipatigenens TaxID=741659 RepID=A0A8J3YUC2_9ACTN|nr:hypothetical protein [Virgisporangium aliadipatigenens]GIJ49898.1 hypothetical protein Val02_67840 [Virgisporangium aliadipatigenens]
MPEIEDCLRRVMAIRGALGARLIDHVSGTTVAAAGTPAESGHDIDAPGPVEVVRTAVGSAAFAPPARPGHLEDIVITASNGYHVLHFVVTPRDARLVLYVRLDRTVGNLAITQHSLRAIGRSLVSA